MLELFVSGNVVSSVRFVGAKLAGKRAGLVIAVFEDPVSLEAFPCTEGFPAGEALVPMLGFEMG